MLALQAVTVALLWLLNAFSVQATAAFAFLLAADVMAFALIAHVYRTAKDDAAEYRMVPHPPLRPPNEARVPRRLAQG